MYSGHMNLAEWAETQGIARVTAYRWFREGKLPVPARKVGGLILVDFPASVAEPPTSETVVYARVSSADQKSDLDRQVARMTVWATGQGMAVDRVVTEVSSDLNGRRKKFLALLKDHTVGTIVVEHRGRFARFAVEYIEAALSAQGRRLFVVEEADGFGLAVDSRSPTVNRPLGAKVAGDVQVRKNVNNGSSLEVDVAGGRVVLADGVGAGVAERSSRDLLPNCPCGLFAGVTLSL
jgi:predicted site-specific integrase-resolvase